MADDDYNAIRDDEFSAQERQRIRQAVMNGEKNIIPLEEMEKVVAKVDDLHMALGWVPATVKNWKAIGIAMTIAVLIGGREFISNVSKFLGGLIQ